MAALSEKFESFWKIEPSGVTDFFNRIGMSLVVRANKLPPLAQENDIEEESGERNHQPERVKFIVVPFVKMCSKATSNWKS